MSITQYHTLSLRHRVDMMPNVAYLILTYEIELLDYSFPLVSFPNNYFYHYSYNNNIRVL